MSQNNSFSYLSTTVYPNHSVFIDKKYLKLEKAENEFINGLLKHQLKVSIAAFVDFTPNPRAQGYFKKDELINIVSLGQAYDRSRLQKIITYFKSILNTYHAIKSSTFNYIFFPGNIAYIAIAMALIQKKPFALYVRGIWNKNILINSINKLFFMNASFILTTGPAFKNELSLYNSRVEEVVPMISLPKNQFNQNRNLDTKSKNRIIFVGRLVKSKGVFDTINAVHILNKKGIDIELDIVGGGDDFMVNDISLFIKNNIKDKIHLHGHISCPVKLSKLIASSYIFVFPTTYPEGFPRVIYEAMILGTPVITTEMPGAKGFLINEINCLITEPNKPDLLANKIEYLLNNHELYVTIRDNATAVMIQKFTNFKEHSHSEQFINAIKSVQVNKINTGSVNPY